MTPAELTLAAALGASFLTVCGSLGVVWFQQWRQDRSADQDALQAAIGEIMSRSLAVAFRARAMGEVMKQRSGLGEGLDIVMRHRKPVDMFELHDWLVQDFAPLNDALSEVWTRGDQDCVRLANEVVDKCGDVIGAGSALEPAKSLRDRARKYVIGERWTPEMLADYEKALKALALSRKRLAEYARSKLGRGPAELFTLADSATVSEIPAAGAGQDALPGPGPGGLPDP